MYVLVGASAGSPSNPSSCKWDPTGVNESLTQVGSTLTHWSFARATLFRGVGLTAKTSVFRATWPQPQDERIIGVWVGSGIDTTTPNGTVATATGTNTTPTATATTTAGQLVLMLAMASKDNTAARTFNSPTGTERFDAATSPSDYDNVAAQDLTASGSSTSPQWTLSGSVNGWAAFVIPLNAASSGGGSYTLTADGGSFVLTGSSAGTLFNRVLSAGSGSFILTGADALRDLSMVADSASFVLTGADATLTYNTSSGGTVNGQTLTATLSLIAGSVNAGALVSGSTVSTTLSLLSGSVNAGAAVSGQTVSSTMSLVAGSVSAGSLVSGTTLIANLSLIAGSASAVQNATVDGYVFITNMSLITGNAFTDGTVKVYNRLLFSPVQPLIRPLIEKIINDD